MNYKKLVINSIGANVIVLALGLLSSVQLSHYIGPQGRGEIAAATLWPMLIVYIASCGQFAATRYYAALPSVDPAKVATIGALLVVPQSMIAIPLAYFVLPALLHSQSIQVIYDSRLFLAVIPVSLLAQNLGSVLQARMQILANNLLSYVIPVGIVVGTLILHVEHRLNTLSFVYLTLTMNVVLLVVAITYAALLGVRLSGQIDLYILKEMTHYGFKVQAGDAAAMLNQRFDQSLMALWLTPVQLGLFVAATSVVSVVQVLSSGMRTVILPKITQQATPDLALRVLVKSFRIYWPFSILLASLIAVMVPFAIPLAFGVKFKPAILPAEVLLLCTVISAAKDVLLGGVQSLGMPWLSSRATICAALLTLVVRPVLIKVDGIMGAAYGGVITYAFELMVLYYGLRASHGVTFWRMFGMRPAEIRQTVIDVRAVVFQSVSARFHSTANS